MKMNIPSVNMSKTEFAIFYSTPKLPLLFILTFAQPGTTLITLSLTSHIGQSRNPTSSTFSSHEESDHFPTATSLV